MDVHTPERALATFVADLSIDDLPAEAVDLAERAILDTVGVTLAGAVADAGHLAGSFARTHAGPGDAGVSLLGQAGRAPTPAAALANGTAGHALDYDDLSWGMDGHPSVTMVAPILAVGEAFDAAGDAAVAAYVAGFETQCYVAEPISPTHYERGWHPTATFGTFGATAATCSLRGMAAETTQQALGIASSMPAGLKRNFGSMSKPLQAGLAARSGVTAALLAGDGFTAGDAPMSGDRGFFDLYADGPTTHPSPPGNPLRLLTAGINVKSYPCCYFAHTSIAATAALVGEHDLDPADIESIHVASAEGGADALVHPEPETGLEAKFSMHHCVAAAAVHDRVGLDAFSAECVADPTVAALRERVEYEVDPELAYDSHAATVRVRTTDGDVHERTQEDPPGVHADPLTAAELREKYLACATHALDESTAAATHDRLASLADEPSVAAVVEALTGG